MTSLLTYFMEKYKKANSYELAFNVYSSPSVYP